MLPTEVGVGATRRTPEWKYILLQFPEMSDQSALSQAKPAPHIWGRAGSNGHFIIIYIIFNNFPTFYNISLLFSIIFNYLVTKNNIAKKCLFPLDVFC